ncbi:MAG: translation initiation factor IF-2 [Candidatus Micrarchaeaceae archaeon]
MIRQPIISVMGHVDHGKTTLLDRIRKTAVAAKEAGGITQHIGASEVPIGVVKEIGGKLIEQMGIKLTIPGLLFIDTPGHEAFTSLRRRGGSISDMAIVVVDVSKGFEPQTVEAIEILKSYKTPFIIAANKIDLINGWISTGSMSFSEAIKKQSGGVEEELMNRIFETSGRLSELGFSSNIFSGVKNFQKEIAIVPVSAKTGEGVAELLMLVAGLSQRFLEARLTIEVHGPGKGSILERKEVIGLGSVIDVIIYDGTLRVNDTIAFAVPGGIATAKIKAILKPAPLSEIRDAKSRFVNVQEVSAAAGIRISANGLEEAMPGSPVVQVTGEGYAEEIKGDISSIFEVDKKGALLKADSIGSIEAISKLMHEEMLGISRKGIGNVTKNDVANAFAMNAVDTDGPAILAFNVKVDPDAEELAVDSGVKIIKGNIIYKLIDDYKLFLDERRKERLKSIEDRVALPGKIEVLPNSCFRVSHPAIFGVKVLAGSIRPNCTMINADGAVIGKIKGVQNEGKPLQSAKRGEMVAISMDEPTFGRQIDSGQVLYTRISRADYTLLKGELANMLSEEEAELLEEIIKIEGPL